MGYTRRGREGASGYVSDGGPNLWSDSTSGSGSDGDSEDGGRGGRRMRRRGQRGRWELCWVDKGLTAVLSCVILRANTT